MRMLLIFTAGVALMSAPALAQSTDSSGTVVQPYGASQSDTGESSADAMQPSEGSSTAPFPGDQSANQPAPQGQPAPDQNVNPAPGATSPDNTGQTQGATRLYQQGQPDQQGQAAPDQNAPGVTSPDNTGRTESNSRLYQQAQPVSSGQNVQVITNGPIPDTRANRVRFRPLSRLGRSTHPRGN